MEKKIRNKIENILGVEAFSRSKTIHHYTSANAVKEIFEDNSILMSNSAFMNDPDDGIYLIDAMLRYIQSRLNGTYLASGVAEIMSLRIKLYDFDFKEQVVSRFQEYINFQEEEILFELAKSLMYSMLMRYKGGDGYGIYISSFTAARPGEEDNIYDIGNEDISFWRAYGSDGEGYRLDIDLHEFLESHYVNVPRKKEKVSFFWVKYVSDADVNRLAEETCNYLVEVLLPHRKKNETGLTKIGELTLIDINCAILFCSALLKSHRYESEREVRAIYSSQNIDFEDISYFIRDNMFVPCLMIKFYNNSNNWFRSVVCGPCTPANSTFSIYGYLRTNNFFDEDDDLERRVKRSSVIYRRKAST